MATPLRLLLVEDNPDDAELVLRALRRAGFEPDGPRVDTEEAYLACLDPGLDVILADYSLPQFDAPGALRWLGERGLDVPCIVVSGSIGDELAAATIRLGATDYLLKDRLGRLGDAVRRALDQRHLRRETRRAEAALRASEEHYRTLVANIPDVTWRADASGARLFVSPNVERVLGLTPEQIRAGGATFWLDRVHSDDRSRVRDAYDALFAAGASYDVDCRVWHADGRWIWLGERATLVDGGDGFPYADGISTDITARKEAEEALRAAKEAADTASRLKSEFLAIVSHELRTPLTTILGFGQLLARDEDELSPRQASRVDRILRSGEHLQHLIDDLLDLAKIEAGRLDVAVTAVDLRPVLGQLRDELSPQAEMKGLALDLDLPADLPQVMADPARLRQLLLNLVWNAVKFTDQGRIVVAAWPEEGAVAIAVADTGIGIAPEALDYVFDEFRQVEDTVARSHGGIGLGLPIARKLAHLLGGSVEVASRPGLGSTFTLRLPTAPGPAGAAGPDGQ
jgi:PAS domain S-box-containing protein